MAENIVERQRAERIRNDLLRASNTERSAKILPSDAAFLVDLLDGRRTPSASKGEDGVPELPSDDELRRLWNEGNKAGTTAWSSADCDTTRHVWQMRKIYEAIARDAIAADRRARSAPEATSQEIELARLAAEHYGRSVADVPALIAFERHRVAQARASGMPGLMALPCFIAGFDAGRDAAVVWSADPPTEQGWYWHWSGNPDDAPFPLSVLWSGTSKTCFIARGQVGEDAVFCDKYGGYWTPVVEPRIPETLPKKGKSK